MSNENEKEAKPRKVPPFDLDQAALRLIHLVLLVDWDPIGVFEYPNCDDEYDRYIPGFYTLLRGGATEDALCEYLRSIEEKNMGLRPKEPWLSRRVARRREAVRKVCEHYPVLVRYAAGIAALDAVE